MTIYTLAENTASSDHFEAEHGLSLYIKTDTHKILFDFGQTNLFERNAELLGLDLADIDTAILSHGHYDHSGGIERFLTLNSKANIYMSKYAFGNHYSGTDRYIGIDQNLKNNERIVFTGDEYVIDDTLSLYSYNNEQTLIDIDSAGLGMEYCGKIVPDDFKHEQYLVINENGKRIVISGCSHKGIINITNFSKPDIIIGGFHFSKIELNTRGKQRLAACAEILKSSGADFYTCHCTGVPQYEFMKETMGNKLKYLSVGNVIKL